MFATSEVKGKQQHMAESILILIALIAMVASLFLILIPALPVTALEWAIAMIFAALTNFSIVTPGVALWLTLLMLIGSTSGLWLPLFGLRGGISCPGLIAFFVGGIIGTAVIPVPFLGTIVGGVVAVLIVEYARVQDWQRALRGGSTALKVILTTMLIEFSFSVLVVASVIAAIIANG